MIDFPKTIDEAKGSYRLWASIAVGALVFQSIYVFTNISFVSAISYFLSCVVGFAPWTFTFSRGSYLEMLGKSDVFIFGALATGIAGVVLEYFYGDSIWPRIAEFLLLISIMTLYRRCAGWGETAGRPAE